MCDEIESLSVQIKNGKFKPFIVTSIYRPPGKLEAQNKESIIIGDINCDITHL